MNQGGGVGISRLGGHIFEGLCKTRRLSRFEKGFVELHCVSIKVRRDLAGI